MTYHRHLEDARHIERSLADSDYNQALERLWAAGPDAPFNYTDPRFRRLNEAVDQHAEHLTRRGL